jgi:hypothetical protein
MGNVFDFDVERGRVKQVQAPSGQHALPGAGRHLGSAIRPGHP